MRSTPLTSCSIGVATEFSTASAEAPGYVAVTRMFGGARKGYCSTDRPRMTTTPSRTIRIDTTMETIGRRMKKFDMVTPLPLLLRFSSGVCGWIDLAARPHLLHPVHDHTLPGAQSLKHNQILVCPVPDADGPQRGFVLGVHHQ